ncbi:hypothetical protein PISMIDRAFT_680828, partial [Pisolithus microcarpus 441]
MDWVWLAWVTLLFYISQSTFFPSPHPLLPSFITCVRACISIHPSLPCDRKLLPSLAMKPGYPCSL